MARYFKVMRKERILTDAHSDPSITVQSVGPLPFPHRSEKSYLTNRLNELIKTKRRNLLYIINQKCQKQEGRIFKQ
jgi:hypothetical protein